MFLTKIGKYSFSDKDSYTFVRIRTPGEILVRMFKKIFSKAVWSNVVCQVRDDVIKNVDNLEPGMKNILNNL